MCYNNIRHTIQLLKITYMKKVLFTSIASAFILLFSSVSAQEIPTAPAAVMQHIAMVFPYHAPQYVLEHSDTVTVEHKDKDQYQVLTAQGAMMTTIRVGEKYLRFKGQYYYNLSQGVMISKLPKEKKEKKPFSETAVGKLYSVVSQNRGMLPNNGFSQGEILSPGQLLQ